jgi:hypothetical protein
MFTAIEASHVLECACHSRVFTKEDLRKTHLVMYRVLQGASRDVFSAMLSRLRPLVPVPTHVYYCNTHDDGWVSNNTDDYECYEGGKLSCDIDRDGCVNNPRFSFPYYDRYGGGFALEHLKHKCKHDGKVVKCPELETYFHKSNDPKYQKT